MINGSEDSLKHTLNRNIKICFAASSGGHLAQILALEPLMREYPSFLLTEKAGGKSSIGIDTYYIKQVNRKEWRCLFYLFINAWASFKILIKEKPDVIISTGVLAVIPLCLIGKLMGKKLIYIESFAKVNTGTITGRVLYRFADYFFVQWEAMKEIYPKAIYKGGLY